MTSHHVKDQFRGFSIGHQVNVLGTARINLLGTSLGRQLKNVLVLIMYFNKVSNTTANNKTFVLNNVL